MLRDSEDGYRLLFESHPQPMWVFDLETLAFLAVNDAAIRHYGYSREEFLTMSLKDIRPVEEAPAFLDRLLKPAQGLVSVGMWRHRKKDGTILDVQITRGTLTFAGRLAGLLLIEDVTERKRAATLLRERLTTRDITARKLVEEVLRQQAEIINQVHDSIISTDLDGYINNWNQGAERLFGYSATEALGKHISLLYPGNEIEVLQRQIIAPLMERGAHQVEVLARRKSGADVYIRLSLSLLRDKTGSPIGMIGYSMDMTEHKRAEEQLLKSREQLRALAARLQSVREEERTRVAREIHDELGQALTGLKMDLSWLDKKISKAEDTASVLVLLEKIRSMSKLVETTIGSVRKISTELRPGVLDALGLTAAIEWQAQEFQTRTGIHCVLDLEAEPTALDRDRVTAIFRIFQETLTNVARHANATQVTIRLQKQGNNLVLEVRDNGRGITEGELSGAQSLGLLGMRERAVLTGGEVDIVGVPEKGTTIRVRVPFGELQAGQIQGTE